MPDIRTADLLYRYDELNPGGQDVAVLLHGWPDDASTWHAVAPRLAAIGRRVIVPTLRGFGASRSAPRRHRAPATARSMRWT